MLRTCWPRQTQAIGLFIAMLSSANALPVFPGAVGFGSHTVAGRGGQVVRVTNLNDSGPGSLRHGVEQVQGPRVIIFEVSGVIELQSDVVVRPSSEGEFGFLTIAGQTAPPPGITLKNAGIAVRSHDVLIQHLAIRPGAANDFATLPRLANRDGIKIEAPEGHTTCNIVIDHVSSSWATDESASIWSDHGSIHDVAFTHSIFSETLRPENADTESGTGALAGRNAYRVSLVGNVMALNRSGNALVRDAVLNVEVVNNLIYQPQLNAFAPITFGAANPDNPDLSLIASVAGNVIIRAPSVAIGGRDYASRSRLNDGGTTSVSAVAVEVHEQAPTGMMLSLKNNSVFNPDTGVWYPTDGKAYGAQVYRTGQFVPKTWTSNPFPYTHSTPWMDAPAVIEQRLVATAGKHPAFRDKIDMTLFETIKNRAGSSIASIEDLSVDSWMRVDAHHRRELPIPAAPNADDDNDGYSNLEEWLHGWAAFVEGRIAQPPTTVAQLADHQSPGVGDTLPAFFQKLMDRVTFPMSWTSGSYANFAGWKKLAQERVRSAWLMPPPPAPWNMTVLEEEDRGRHVVRKLVFNVSGDSRVLAYMTVPKGKGPFPAVLLLHSHGGRFAIGKEKVLRPIGVSDEMSKESERLSSQHVAGKLSDRGYVTFVTDAINWGDRGGGGNEGQQALASNLMQMGMSFAGIMAWEDLRTADFLAEQPEVDATRIAAMGFSMGAYRTWQVTAMSDKIAAGVSICWMGTVKSMFSPGMNQTRGGAAYSMLHPGLLEDLDYPDIASIAAPKPMLFYGGRYDRLFPQSGVEESYAKMRAVWESQGAGDRLVTETWPVEHKFTPEMQEKTFAWLDRVMPNNSSQ